MGNGSLSAYSSRQVTVPALNILAMISWGTVAISIMLGGRLKAKSPARSWTSTSAGKFRKFVEK
jgi:hypothetical protein